MLDSPAMVRAAVRGFEPYSPGLSIDEIQEKYGLSKVIKLASNENPLGTSPLVREALCRHAGMAFRYAQSGNPRLVRAVAGHLGVDPSSVVLGNGSDEVIDLLIRCRAEPGVDNVVAFDPCFSLYPLQAQLCGVEMRRVRLNADFTFDWDGLRALVDDNTALVFVTTPDNPSGYCPPVAELAELAGSLPKGALLVLDEAYMDFCGDEAAHSLLGRIGEFPNVAVLRTFSKSFGLAGLRLGYGVMPPELADYLCRVRPPFSVNILAEAAGMAALADTDFRAATMRTVTEGRAMLQEGLKGLGCRTHESWSNFIMFRLPEGAKLDAAGFFEELLKRGVIIRRLRSYGLDEYLRVSVGDSDENAAFIGAAKEILHGEI